MISRAYIMEWRQHVPWQNMWQVEQDLLISKALQDIYNHPGLKEALAFRGGTALNKLFLKPAFRYSEDIDLVQVSASPIGETLQTLRSVLSWLGDPKYSSSHQMATLTYKGVSEDGLNLKIKVEVNTREHFAVLGWQKVVYPMVSSWYTGEVVIKTYCIEEMLGTKLRALYQRRKGRDLYDVYQTLLSLPVDPHQVVKCFRIYMERGNTPVTRDLFEANMLLKLENEDFKKDIWPLLPPNKEKYDAKNAYEYVCDHLLRFWPIEGEK